MTQAERADERIKQAKLQLNIGSNNNDKNNHNISYDNDNGSTTMPKSVMRKMIMIMKQ